MALLEADLIPDTSRLDAVCESTLLFDMNSITNFFHDWSFMVQSTDSLIEYFVLLPNRQESRRPSPERYGSDHPRDGRHKATHCAGHLHQRLIQGIFTFKVKDCWG